MMKIILCYGDNEHSKMLMAQLAEKIEPYVAGIVIEERGSLINLIRYMYRRFKRYGFLKLMDQALLFVYRKLTIKKLDPLMLKNCENYLNRFSVLRVLDINDRQTAEFVKAREADFLISLGTGYVRKPVREAAKINSVNVHAGLNPRYRGADPLFWAIYEKNFLDLGTTVHCMDEGLDTGEILFRKRIPLLPGDTIELITVRSIKEGLEGVRQLLEFYEKNRKFPVFQETEPLEARTYGWYGLSDYLIADKILKTELAEMEKK